MMAEAIKPIELKRNGSLKAFHWARRTFWVVAVVIVFNVLVFLYPGGIWPFDPVQYHWIRVHTPIVHQGGAYKFDLYMTKNVNIVPQISRKLIKVDKNGKELEEISLPSFTLGNRNKGTAEKQINIGIPSWVEPGRYYIKNIVVYDYFGMKKVEDNYLTPIFEVVE